jgi:hydrogenase expression/formation protein HypD
MKYIDEYRDRSLIGALSAEIRKISRKEISLMEVCGGHTMAIHRFALASRLPGNIRLLSGPGCPVCVSAQGFIDTTIEMSRAKDVIITTYGDLIRVPGSHSSLEKERAKGADIRIIYSVLDALELAKNNPNRKIVLPGIGFETTAPLTASAILQAIKTGIDNFFLLSAHKIMPPVMATLVSDGVRIDGFIAPGHVSAITGTGIYRNLAARHGLGVVVSGFEPADIMQSILMLVKQVESGKPEVAIQYTRVVKPGGNRVAQKIMEEVFETADDAWRGLGIIPASGLQLRSHLGGFDALKTIPVTVAEPVEPAGCICGDILRGTKIPTDCTRFARSCTPTEPTGACMVSAEGTCATYYKYRQS